MSMTRIARVSSTMVRTGRSLLVTTTAATTLVLLGGAAFALDEAASEKDVLKACEKQLCQITVKKEASGADLACSLSKTWSKKIIEDGIAKKKLTWGFGDARCTIDVKARRSSVIDAVSKPEQSFEFDPHTIKCQIEREGEVTTINVTLAPKINFKGGKAEKAWLNIKEIDAPSVIKGAIWSAAKIEDNFGLFHSEMISEINELIGQKCPKVMAGN